MNDNVTAWFYLVSQAGPLQTVLAINKDRCLMDMEISSISGIKLMTLRTG
jgi:hypothetical protein